jgi:hypothetical protein
MRLVSEGLLQMGQVRGHTIDFLLVYLVNGIVIRVTRRDRVLEWVAQIVVAWDQVIEEACAAVVAPVDRRIAAAGRQI